MTTGAKPTSVEAVLDALRQHPDATAAEVAEHAGIGRSTAARTLASLEAQGRATRQRGTAEAGGTTAPDRWALGPDTPGDQLEAGRPMTQEPAAEPADATVTASRHEDADSTNAPAAADAGTASEQAEAATTDSTQATGKDSGQRLRPGGLRALVHAWLAERPGQEFTPTKIGKELGRSAGAVGNALATMTDAGEVTQTSTKPRKYMLTAQPSQAIGTETAAAS
jgi:DNA-binding MarR family transcriptional regulator